MTDNVFNSQEHIDYVRSFNPTYKLTKSEALKYAARMGSMDTLRGIGQIFGSTFGMDEVNEHLKKTDNKLREILAHPEYGTEATATFLASGIVADPISYVPIAGWIAKGKKAKSLADLTKYGAVSGGAVSGLGYTSEDTAGFFVDEDAGLVSKRLENIALGLGAGAVLGAGGGALVDSIQKARGKGSIFKQVDEFEPKQFDDVPVDAKELEKPLKVGSTIRAPDRGNTGTIVNIDEEKGIASVVFSNRQTGNTASKKFTLESLQPAKAGQAPVKPAVDVSAEGVEKYDDIIFTQDPRSYQGNKILTTTDPETKTTYVIRKALDENNKIIPKQWEVISKPQLIRGRKKGESEAQLKNRRRKQQTLTLFQNKEQAKKFISQQIQVNKKPARTVEEAKDIIIKENLKSPQTKYTLKGPLLKQYQTYVGTPMKNAVFNNPGEGLGFITGYNAYGDDESTYAEKITAGLLLAGGIRYAKNIKIGPEESVKDFVGRGIISDYGLSPEYITARQKFRVNKNEIGAEFLEIVKKAEKDLNKEQRKLLYNFMTGDMRALEKLSDEALEINDEARAALIKHGQDLVNKGLLKENIFKKNINTYLKRSYLREDKVAGSNTMALNNRQIKIIGDELRPRGLIEEIKLTSYNKPDSKWKKEGWEILEELKDGKVRIRRDYTKAERTRMGEIEDASYAIAETGRLLANDIATAKFFKQISQDKNLVLDKVEYEALAPDVQSRFTLMSDSILSGTNKKRFGALAGKYVDQDVARDLNHIYNYSILREKGGLYKFSSNIGRGFNSLQSIWKKTKTAWNLGTHVGNTASNVMLLDFADVKGGVSGGLKLVGKAIKEMRDPNSALHRQAQIDGIFDADLISKEFKDSLSEIETALMKLQGDDVGSGILEKSKLFLQNNKLKKLTLDKMERAYQLEDQIFRMAVYMDRLKNKGFSQTDAALDARKWFIDYDINAPVIQALKRTFVPFISYTYRVIPLLAEAATLRPHKFAKWAVLGHGLNQGFSYMTEGGATQEKIDRLTMREEQNKRLFGDVPVIGDLMPNTTIRMPVDDKYGNSLYFDYARWVPGGDIFEQRETRTQVPLLPSPLQPGGLYWDAISNIIFKTDPFTGRTLEDLGIDEEDYVDIGLHFLSRLPPNIPGIPGTFASKKWEKAKAIERGAEGSEYATKDNPFAAIAYGLGIKLRPQSLDVNIKTRELVHQKKVDSIMKQIRALESDYDKYGLMSFGSLEEFDRQIQELEEELIRVNAEYEIYQQKLTELLDQRDLERREKKVKGGLVTGIADVPFTKEDPATRRNQVTGEPFKEEMNRLGFQSE
tara:strand:+ start:1453 stop:5394 length:3942 start_codon:yes stop_codon:yes gene_type:complete